MTRTTLALDTDVLDLVRNLAAARNISMGEAANMLIRRGLEARSETCTRNGFVMFGDTLARMNPQDLTTADAADDAEYAKFFK